MAEIHTVETLQDRIARLVAERQSLRQDEASEGALEHNRREIASSQHELSWALIARHAPNLAA